VFLFLKREISKYSNYFIGIQKANDAITTTVKNVVSKSNLLLDGLKYRSQTYITNTISNQTASNNSSNNNNLNGNSMPINNMNLNNSSSSQNELFLWSQPTSSFNIDESQIIDNTPAKKKSTPHISTYTLTQLTHLDNFDNQNNSQTSNSNIVLTQENIIAPDKDGKRFKCRKL